MTVRIRIASFFVAIGVAAIALATGLILNQQLPDSELGVESLRKIIEQDSGTIEVSGIVVDEDGVALDGVGIEVAEVDPADMFGELRNRKIMRVDREFHIRRRGVETVECRFFKKGYYDVRHSFSISKGTSSQEDGSLKRDGFKVVLLQVPEPAPLEKIEGYLSSSRDGPSSVLMVQTSALDGSDKNYQFILDPGTQSNGALRIVVTAIEGVAGPQSVLEVGRIIISPSELGDGFASTKITAGRRPVKYGFRKMTVAPVEGYSPFLPIGAASSEEDAFFYCRIGGRYGKGVVTTRAPVIVKNGVETAGARIVVYLNPTGSRDVSYIHF